jgi:hypothetical protein
VTPRFNIVLAGSLDGDAVMTTDDTFEAATVRCFTSRTVSYPPNCCLISKRTTPTSERRVQPRIASLRMRTRLG